MLCHLLLTSTSCLSFRYLGQLLDGEDAVAALQKGIEVLQNIIEQQVMILCHHYPLRILILLICQLSVRAVILYVGVLL